MTEEVKTEEVKTEEVKTDGEVTIESLKAELALKEELLTTTRAEAAQRRVKAKEFEGVDIEEYREMKAAQEAQKQKDLETSGNFEEAKKSIVDSYTVKLDESAKKTAALEAQLKTFKINDAILGAAAKQNALNPEQIVLLLKDNISLNSEGNAEVRSADGTTKFDGEGVPLKVSTFVENYLAENAHLVRGTSAGTGSGGGEHKSPGAELYGRSRIEAALAKRDK